jgi:hypothetical protein
MPIYKGGDQTQSPFLSTIYAPTNPINNTIAFLSGEGEDKFDYLFTRSYSKWLNQDLIWRQTRDYTSINVTETVFRQPWLEPIEVNGTDGT